MPTHRHLLIHSNGPALWPEHKPLNELLELRATTPPNQWEATYQCNPTAPGGTIFRREWWTGKNRYNIEDRAILSEIQARYISWDTAGKDKESNDYTAYVVGELLNNYRLIIRKVGRGRLTFPALPQEIVEVARIGNRDDKLRGVIIEDTGSGTSALQSLSQTEDEWFTRLLAAYNPKIGKVERANQASTWCLNNMIWLPHPQERMEWLMDFEDELFDFPGAPHDDQVDAFTQLVIYVEHYLARGWHGSKSLEQGS